jgi:exopolysaccharide/PEP-CTERM locus tyrosine autokinase
MGKLIKALEGAKKRQEAKKGLDPDATRVPAPEKVVKPTPKSSGRKKAPIREEAPKRKEVPRKVVPLQEAPKPAPTYPLSPHLVTFHKPYSQKAEIFKQLRTNILFPSEGTPPKSIMITSAVPGEGKSFMSANLAISIAKGIEEHVLLMDCDMRNPTIHGLFGMQTVPGLSDYLTKNIMLSSLLAKTPVPKLTILPGGRPPSNPTELLSSQQMTDLLEEVKTRYEDRYIIIDSPPPKLTAETSALARRVDGIILVIRARSTLKSQVEDLLEIVGKEKIMGVMMNWYDPALPRYFGYEKYGEYYHKE